MAKYYQKVQNFVKHLTINPQYFAKDFENLDRVAKFR